MQPELTTRGFPLLIYGLKSGGLGALELSNDEAVVLWEVDFTFEGKAPVAHLKVAQLQDEV